MIRQMGSLSLFHQGFQLISGSHFKVTFGTVRVQNTESWVWCSWGVVDEARLTDVWIVLSWPLCFAVNISSLCQTSRDAIGLINTVNYMRFSLRKQPQIITTINMHISPLFCLYSWAPQSPLLMVSALWFIYFFKESVIQLMCMANQMHPCLRCNIQPLFDHQSVQTCVSAKAIGIIYIYTCYDK